MVRPERLLALHRQGRLLSSFHLLSRLGEASNITTRAISQFPRPVFHRQDTQHYGLQTKFTKCSNFASSRAQVGSSAFRLPALAAAIGNGGEKLFRFEKRRAGELFFFARYRLTQRFVDLRLVWRGARLRCPLF